MNRRILSSAAALTLSLAMPALAVPTTMVDSSQFTFKYEMNTLLGSQDLDGNANPDWFAGVSGGITQPTVAGGLGISNQAAATPEILWRTDFTNSLSRSTVNGNFTIEASIRLNGDSTPSNTGGFGFALQQPGQTNSLRFNIDETNVSFNSTGTGAIATGSNSDGFHLYRIAFEGANNYWVWRDGVLLNTNLATPFVGSNGSFNASGAWFLGDFTGSINGNWNVDFIRVTAGSFAPTVPEPATGAMLLTAVAATALRRRRSA